MESLSINTTERVHLVYDICKFFGFDKRAMHHLSFMIQLFSFQGYKII